MAIYKIRIIMGFCHY